MVRLQFVAFCLVSLAFCRCNSSNTNNTQATKTDSIASTPKIDTFANFIANFDTAVLAYPVPNDDSISPDKEIDKKYIEKFFAGKEFEGAFGIKHDVPDIIRNLSSSTYYSDAIVPDSGKFRTVIIQKIDEGHYYFLCTFTPSGQFIDGMCVAFTEKSKEGSTERTSSINEDGSIQVRQKEITHGQKRPAIKSSFFEITPDGYILNLNPNA